MKLLEKKFVFRGSSWVWLDGDICDAELQDLFDLPDTVRTVWIALHTRASQNRVRVTVRLYNDESYDSYPEIKVEGAVGDLTSPDWDKYLEPLIGKTLYAEVRYMG